MLLPFLGKKDEERRAIINSIGSVWDGNEVWLLTAGGATFAAFPEWYATMFSGFYLALFLLLVGLILRGISFEYRSKDAAPAWRNRFDWMIAIGSFLSALLLGAAFANLARGVVNPGIVPITAVAVLLMAGYFINRKMEGWSFIMVALNIVLTQVTFFSMTFPNVMLSTTNPAWSLTIYNASSSQYTLTVMSIVALIFVPIVLAYQGWTYYMFRKRISTDKKTLVY